MVWAVAVISAIPAVEPATKTPRAIPPEVVATSSRKVPKDETKSIRVPSETGLPFWSRTSAVMLTVLFVSATLTEGKAVSRMEDCACTLANNSPNAQTTNSLNANCMPFPEEGRQFVPGAEIYPLQAAGSFTLQ